MIDDWQDAARDLADWSPLTARADLDFLAEPLRGEAAARALGGYQIIVAMRDRTRFDAALLRTLPSLCLLVVAGGTGAVDVATAHALGIDVVAAPASEPAATAELALGLMIAANRDILAGDVAVRSGRFQRGTRPGRLLAGSTLGIVGLGKVGALVAAYARAVGMEIWAWSPHLTDARADAAGARRAPSLFALLSCCDVATLHLVLSDDTRALIGAPQLATMRPGALLVNTARSGLIAREPLLAMLEAGRVRAAIDVFDEEPPHPDDALLNAPGTLLTPHFGFVTCSSLAALYEAAIAATAPRINWAI